MEPSGLININAFVKSIYIYIFLPLYSHIVSKMSQLSFVNDLMPKDNTTDHRLTSGKSLTGDSHRMVVES